MSNRRKDNRRRKKNVLIRPRFQVWFGFRMAFAAFGLGIANTLIFYFYIRENYEVFYRTPGKK